jgi:hypothetical protein
MTTLAQLRAALHTDLSDTAGAVWPAATIDQWLCDGLDEIAATLPRPATATIPCTAGVTAYDLATLVPDYLALTGAYFPAADPTAALYRLDADDPAFGPGHYDLRGATLHLGATPAAADAITITYHARYAHPAADADELQLPAPAHETLKRFVIWKASQERLNAELQCATENSVKLSLLSTTAMRAERAYRTALTAISQTTHASPPGAPRQPTRWANRWA